MNCVTLLLQVSNDTLIGFKNYKQTEHKSKLQKVYFDTGRNSVKM